MSFFSFSKESVLRALWVAVALLAAIFLTFGSEYRFSKTSGSSMEPTYKNKEIVIYKIRTKDCSFARFDAVIILQNEELLFKRIIALPNETVETREGFFYINGKKISDPYSSVLAGEAVEPITIRENSYFYAGDNRKETVFGICDLNEIVGRVIF